VHEFDFVRCIDDMCRDYYCDVYCALCTGQAVASNKIFELTQVYVANNIPQGAIPGM